MSEHLTIHFAYCAAQLLRPYTMDAKTLAAITPSGGSWSVDVSKVAVTRSVVWNGIEVAVVNPQGSLSDNIEGEIAMALRATPVLDKALRVILKLARDGSENSLIAKIAETAVAFIELPAPLLAMSEEIDDSDDEGNF